MTSNVYDYYYENYLMLYGLYGRGRPRVSREKYEELDRELLVLIDRLRPEEIAAADSAASSGSGPIAAVADNQRRLEESSATSSITVEPERARESLEAVNRMREIEYILLDDIAEALLDNKAPKATTKHLESTMIPAAPPAAPNADI